jgi:hypothetical protein
MLTATRPSDVRSSRQGGRGRSSVIYWPPGRILIPPTRPVSAHGSWRSALQTTTLRSSFRRAPDDCLVLLSVRIC